MFGRRMVIVDSRTAATNGKTTRATDDDVTVPTFIIIPTTTKTETELTCSASVPTVSLPPLSFLLSPLLKFAKPMYIQSIAQGRIKAENTACAWCARHQRGFAWHARLKLPRQGRKTRLSRGAHGISEAENN
jgi:hypothetical protein